MPFVFIHAPRFRTSDTSVPQHDAIMTSRRPVRDPSPARAILETPRRHISSSNVSFSIGPITIGGTSATDPSTPHHNTITASRSPIRESSPTRANIELSRRHISKSNVSFSVGDIAIARPCTSDTNMPQHDDVIASEAPVRESSPIKAVIDFPKLHVSSSNVSISIQNINLARPSTSHSSIAQHDAVVTSEIPIREASPIRAVIEFPNLHASSSNVSIHVGAVNIIQAAPGPQSAPVQSFPTTGKAAPGVQSAPVRDLKRATTWLNGMEVNTWEDVTSPQQPAMTQPSIPTSTDQVLGTLVLCSVVTLLSVVCAGVVNVTR